MNARVCREPNREVYSRPPRLDKPIFVSLGPRLEHFHETSGSPMWDFEAILKSAVAEDDLLSLVLSKPCAVCGVSAEKITVRPMELRGTRFYQWSARSKNGQETHQNLPPNETLEKACELFGASYAHGHVFTSEADFAARKNRKGQIQVKTSAPSKRPQVLQGTHNREKQYLLPENQPCPFLAEIGVMTPAGKVKASRYKKFRQINRYLELINDVVPYLPNSGPIRVVDFGCGKSYLTFALHHLLTVIHRREVHIVGLDRKADVVRDCRQIANRLDCRGLEFREGDLWSHEEERIHLAVSLHACDTATDEAIAKAVAWQAEAIFAVPCCQHEIAAKLPAEFLPAVQEHGILKDRLAAILTDALRAGVGNSGLQNSGRGIYRLGTHRQERTHPGCSPFGGEVGFRESRPKLRSAQNRLGHRSIPSGYHLG